MSCTLFHLSGLISLKTLHERAFRYLFKGVPAQQIQRWALKFLEETFDQLLYAPAIERLNLAKEAGHFIVILSSAPEFLVEPIAHRLNIMHWKATEYGLDKKACYSHLSKLMLGTDKASYINHLKSQKKTSVVTAYSDSYFDLPFLLSADVAIGVNPDRKLKAICKNRKWLII